MTSDTTLADFVVSAALIVGWVVILSLLARPDQTERPISRRTMRQYQETEGE